MSDNCNTENSKNYPLLPSIFACNTSINAVQENKYIDYGYISEVSQPLIVATPSRSAYVELKLPGIPVTPSNNNNALIITPSGTPAFTPTPTKALPVKFYFELQFTIFTELEIILNLKTKKLILKHLRDGNLPLNPILVKSNTFIGNILSNSSVSDWNIPWSTTLTVDRETFNTTSSTIISNLAKQGIYVNIVNNIQNINEFKNIKIIEENGKLYFTGMWSDTNKQYIDIPVKVLIKDYIPNTSQKISSQTSSEFEFTNDSIPITTNYQININNIPSYINPNLLYVKDFYNIKNNILSIIVKDNIETIKDVSSPWNIGVTIF